MVYFRPRTLILCAALSTACAFTLAVPRPRADATLDLRKKVVDFSILQTRKCWAAEDRMIQRERQFQDGLQQEYREAKLKGLRQIKDAPNWKAAKRAYNQQMRDETALIRQKVRVHRDEFDLKLLANYTVLEKDLRAFLAPLEQQFRENKEEAFRKAQDDFNTSRDELREELRDWKDRVRDLKTASDFSAD